MHTAYPFLEMLQLEMKSRPTSVLGMLLGLRVVNYHPSTGYLSLSRLSRDVTLEQNHGYDFGKSYINPEIAELFVHYQGVERFG